MKLFSDWENSGKSFTAFAQPGDPVEERIVDHFLNILPPFMHSGSIQSPEACDYVQGRNTYLTFARAPGGGWIYAGQCHYGKTTEPTA